MPSMRNLSMSVMPNDPQPMPGGNDQYTKMLLHFDALGLVPVIDSAFGASSPHTFTNTAVTQIETSKKFGISAGAFNGTSSYLEIITGVSDLSLAATDLFEFDFYFKPTAVNQKLGFLAKSDYATDGFALYWDNADTKFYFMNKNATVFSVTQALVVNTWYHLALVGTGSLIKLYFKGSEIVSTTQPNML